MTILIFILLTLNYKVYKDDWIYKYQNYNDLKLKNVIFIETMKKNSSWVYYTAISFARISVSSLDDSLSLVALVYIST